MADPSNERDRDADDERVTALLGRRPAGRYRVVVRDDSGEPLVIRNAPLLDDGTPMPTRFWLVGREAVAAVSRLEAAGGVRAAEAAVDPAELAAAHARYAAERDADIPASATHRPEGGVGGTRQGVKCLHAHYAWYLAGGDDPVGRWVAAQLTDRLAIDIGSDAISLRLGSITTPVPTTPADLVAELTEHDPPAPQSLTNAIGSVTDDIDNLLRVQPELGDAETLELLGEEAWHLAAVERGSHPDPTGIPLTVSRDDLEDLFRTLATEPRADRLHNPALEPRRAESVLATCCAVLAVMRRLRFSAATFVAPGMAEAH
ncbi:MAG: DUF501 domain-containing protein [Acidimicrobiales bacterium]